MAAGTEPLERCGERLARLVSLAVADARRDSRATVRGTPTRHRRRPRKRAVLRPRPDLGQGPRAPSTRARGVRARRAGRAVRQAGLAAPARPDERADPDDPDPEQRRHRTPRSRSRRCAAVPGRSARAGAPQPGCRLGRRRAAGRRRARLGRGRVRATPRAGRHDPAGRPGEPEGATHPGHTAGDPRGTRRLLARVPRRHVRARGTRLADARSTASARRPPRSCCCSRSVCR